MLECESGCGGGGIFFAASATKDAAGKGATNPPSPQKTSPSIINFSPSTYLFFARKTNFNAKRDQSELICLVAQQTHLLFCARRKKKEKKKNTALINEIVHRNREREREKGERLNASGEEKRPSTGAAAVGSRLPGQTSEHNC